MKTRMKKETELLKIILFDDGEAVYSRDGDGVMEINFN